MSEDQLKVLQEELAALRNRAKRRTFRQVLKDAGTKFLRTIDKESETLEEFVVQTSLVIIGFLTVISLIFLAIATTVHTNGLILLLFPAYVIYYLLRKD